MDCLCDRAARRRNAGAAARLLALAGVLVGAACGVDPAPESARPFRVESFNHAGLDGVPLNAVLVFRFSADVNPLSVNSDTIRIATTLGGTRHQAEGSFVVSGPAVTWFPRMTSHPLPEEAEGERTRESSAPLLPADAGLNTVAAGLAYEVVIPARPSPNTVRDHRRGQTLHEPFVAGFRTVAFAADRRPCSPRDLAPLYSRHVPHVRHPLRVADVLAYAGGGFLEWTTDPARTAGENPLFLNPALLAAARDAWRDDEATGEWVDQLFGIQLLPRLTGDELAHGLPPSGVSLLDERLLSNRLGPRPGRPKEVTGLRIFFTHAVVPNAFVGPRAPDGDAAVEVRVLLDPADDPEGLKPVACSITLHNDADLQAGEVTLSLTTPIRRGWIHLRLDPAQVSGFAGTPLEGNRGRAFTFLWPVVIRAE
ncbi:MAG: hypothetical protein JXQ29_13505 [Planctomycetes bacterium]|nr:hypothetical protein [Planctomycetota bacterium]